MNRRGFFRISLGTGLLAGSGYILKTALWPAPLDAADRRVLAAFLDTLIPADALGPGATDLGVDRELLARAAGDRAYRRFLRRGVDWLDARADERGGVDFAALDAAAREAVVSAAEAAAERSLEHRFFRQVRRDAMSAYYAHPQTWPAVGFDGPPQPLGFPDYQSPPGRA